MVKPEKFGHLNLVYHFTVKLTIFCVNFPVKVTCELFLKGFFLFLKKSVNQPLLDGWFYLLLSLKLFSQKKFVLLKLPHLITLLLRLATSWWSLIIEGRCNNLSKWHLKMSLWFQLLATEFLADKLKNIFERSGERGNTAMKLFP